MNFKERIRNELEIAKESCHLVSILVEGNGSEFVTGKVDKVTQRTVTVDAIGPHAEWLDVSVDVPVRDIREVVVGTEYLNDITRALHDDVLLQWPSDSPRLRKPEKVIEALKAAKEMNMPATISLVGGREFDAKLEEVSDEYISCSTIYDGGLVDGLSVIAFTQISWVQVGSRRQELASLSVRLRDKK